MEKLEKLTRDELGRLYRADGGMIWIGHLTPKGKIKPLVVKNPCLDIADVIDEMARRDALFIPQGANAYLASDFSPDTQHARQDPEGKKEMFSVYAIQFYFVMGNY